MSSTSTPRDKKSLYLSALDVGTLLLITVVQLLLVSACWWLGPHAAAADSALLGSVWQVHAAFTSVGFAGLAIAFQVLGDPPLSAGSARQSVVEYLAFRRLLVAGVVSDLIIGGVTLWFANRATVTVAFVFVLVPSVVLVAAAYGRLAHLFTSSIRVENLTLVELTRRMVAAATTATAQEKAVAEFVEEIDGARGLVRGSLPTEVGLPLRQVVSPYPAQYVASLRIGSLVRAADWLFDAASRSSGRSWTYDYPQRISVRVRPHRLCRPGHVLFEMHIWPEISETDWMVIDRYLLASIVFASESEIDSRTVFEQEMAALQDSVLAAVRDQQLARLERGFRYYHHVIDAARRSDGPNAGLRDPRWFERQIWEIDDAAARASDRFALVAISDAQQMAMTAVNTGDLPWLQVALTRIQHAWSAMVQTKPAGAKNALENLLVALQNLAEFAIPYAKTSTVQTEAAAAAAVRAFAALAKEAFDAGEYGSADRVLGYLSGLWDLDRDEVGGRIGVEVACAQGAVLAWMLLVRSRSEVATSSVIDLDSFRVRFRKPDLLQVARKFEEGRDQAPWRFWESRDALPLQTHVLEFDEFFWRALLLLGADGRLSLRENRVSAEDRYILYAIINAKVKVLDEWTANRGSQEPLDAFVARLRASVADLDVQRRQVDAAMELSTEKMQSFLGAMAEAIRGGLRLIDFLNDAPIATRGLGGSDESGGAPAEEGWHLSNSAASDADKGEITRVIGRIFNGIPRTFFIDSEVIAFADTLGQQIGATFLREQDAHIVGALLRGETLVEIPANDLRDEVLTRAGSLQDAVIVYNGQPEVEELLDLKFDDEDRVSLAGIHAFSLYIGGADFLEDLLLIDRSTVPQFKFSPEKNPGFVLVPGTDVSVEIRPADLADVISDSSADSDFADQAMMRIETGQIMTFNDRASSVVRIKITRPESPSRIDTTDRPGDGTGGAAEKARERL